MPYNPHIHHRRSIRLKGYDYSQEGLYFITLCCQDRACLFGEIIDGKMKLNDTGKIVDECWTEIPNHFPNSILHEYIVMPNHIHGIIELKSVFAAAAVGAENFPPNTVSNDEIIIPPNIGSNDDFIIPPNAGSNDIIIPPNTGTNNDNGSNDIDIPPNAGSDDEIVIPPNTGSDDDNGSNDMNISPNHGAENDNGSNNGIRANDYSPLRQRSPSNTIGSIVRGFKIGVTKWMRQNTAVKNVWQRNYYEHIIRNESSYQTISKYIVNNPANWAEDKFYLK